MIDHEMFELGESVASEKPFDLEPGRSLGALDTMRKIGSVKAADLDPYEQWYAENEDSLNREYMELSEDERTATTFEEWARARWNFMQDYGSVKRFAIERNEPLISPEQSFESWFLANKRSLGKRFEKETGLGIDLDEVDFINWAKSLFMNMRIGQASVKTVQPMTEETTLEGEKKDPEAKEDSPEPSNTGGGAVAPSGDEAPPESVSEEQPTVPEQAQPDLLNKLTAMDVQMLNMFETQRELAKKSLDLRGMETADAHIREILQKYTSDLDTGGSFAPEAFIARRMQIQSVVGIDMWPLVSVASEPLFKLGEWLGDIRVVTASIAKLEYDETSLNPEDGTVEWVVSLAKLNNPAKTGIIKVQVRGGDVELVPIIWDTLGRKYNLDVDGVAQFLGEETTEKLQGLEKKYLEQDLDHKPFMSFRVGSKKKVSGKMSSGRAFKCPVCGSEPGEHCEDGCTYEPTEADLSGKKTSMERLSALLSLANPGAAEKEVYDLVHKHMTVIQTDVPLKDNVDLVLQELREKEGWSEAFTEKFAKEIEGLVAEALSDKTKPSSSTSLTDLLSPDIKELADGATKDKGEDKMKHFEALVEKKTLQVEGTEASLETDGPQKEFPKQEQGSENCEACHNDSMTGEVGIYGWGMGQVGDEDNVVWFCDVCKEKYKEALLTPAEWISYQWSRLNPDLTARQGALKKALITHDPSRSFYHNQPVMIDAEGIQGTVESETGDEVTVRSPYGTKTYKKQDLSTFASRKVFAETEEELLDAAVEKLEEVAGMASPSEFLIGEFSEEESWFKTMSDHGEKDNIFADKIYDFFAKNNIPYKLGLQHRVFSVENVNLSRIVTGK